MAFNGLCTRDELEILNNDSIVSYDTYLKLKVPKPSYEVLTKIKKYGSYYNKVSFKVTKEVQFSMDNIPNWIEVSLFSIKIWPKEQLIALHIKNKSLNCKYNDINEPNVILYSHENETDLLRLLPFLVDLSIQMKCNIVSYDYLGFGCSSGKANIKNIPYGGEEIMNFITAYLKYSIENVSLIGRGIGAISSKNIASSEGNRNCNALILVEPIFNCTETEQNDFKNILCPTLFIKEIEEEDENNINVDQIVLLCRLISNEKEWFPKRKGRIFDQFCNSIFENSDIIFRHRNKFFSKIRTYIHPKREKIELKRSRTVNSHPSTHADSNSVNIREQDLAFSLDKPDADRLILNLIDIKDDNKIENKINKKNMSNDIKGKKNQKEIGFYEEYEDEEEINNNEDY